MYRLSIIIGEIYNKFLPRAEKGNVSLNLDFADTTQEISNPEEIRTAVEQALDSAFQRTDRGDISISVTPTEIIIADSGTILSKSICALLSHGRVQVKSRVGFGTSVHVALGPATTSDSAKTPDHNAKPTTNTPKSNPAPASSVKTTSKPASQAAPKTVSRSISRRSIDAAAKRTDKKIQKIAEKAQKRLQKSASKSRQRCLQKSASKPQQKRKVIRKFDIS